jgi:hypothetical protein
VRSTGILFTDQLMEQVRQLSAAEAFDSRSVAARWPGSDRHRQGGRVPSEQTTVAPGGNSTVFDAGGRGLLLLKLMQPPNAKKISRIRTRMVILGSGALSQALSF